MTRVTVFPWILLLTSVAAVAVAAGINALRPARPSPQGFDIIGPDVAAVARLEAKQRITDEVIDGRLTLLGAAAGFRALDAVGSPYPAPWIVDPSPVGSMEEKYCRMVIGWVRGEAPPGRADELARPLEGELAARLKDGTLRLPD